MRGIGVSRERDPSAVVYNIVLRGKMLFCNKYLNIIPKVGRTGKN